MGEKFFEKYSLRGVAPWVGMGYVQYMEGTQQREPKQTRVKQMSINNAIYSNKATAKRGAARKGITNPAFIVLEDGRVELRDLDRPLYNAAARERSAVKGAVGMVWDIAKDMYAKGARRKEIIAACVDAGVALNTAKTQLQHYRKAAGMVGA